MHDVSKNPLLLKFKSGSAICEPCGNTKKDVYPGKPLKEVQSAVKNDQDAWHKEVAKHVEAVNQGGPKSYKAVERVTVSGYKDRGRLFWH